MSDSVVNPKQLIHNSEVCFGVPHVDARRLAGLDEHMPREGGEVGCYGRGGQVLNALRRINARLKLLRRTCFVGEQGLGRRCQPAHLPSHGGVAVGEGAAREWRHRARRVGRRPRVSRFHLPPQGRYSRYTATDP